MVLTLKSNTEGLAWPGPCVYPLMLPIVPERKGAAVRPVDWYFVVSGCAL